MKPPNVHLYFIYRVLYASVMKFWLAPWDNFSNPSFSYFLPIPLLQSGFYEKIRLDLLNSNQFIPWNPRKIYLFLPRKYIVFFILSSNCSTKSLSVNFSKTLQTVQSFGSTGLRCDKIHDTTSSKKQPLLPMCL